MSGGIAYVLDEHNDLYTRLNKSLISIEELTNKYDVQELKEMITEHAKTTGSAKGKYILEHFSEYLPKFKKIIPNDYKRMLNAIVLMEEKGLSSEQAQIEAFYANAEENKGGEAQWESQQDLWNMPEKMPRLLHQRQESKTIMNFTRSCLRLRENSRQPDVWTAVCRFVSMEK